MSKLRGMLAACALGVAGCGSNAAAPANEAAAKPANPKLFLPLYEEAVVIKRPVLPARMADGDDHPAVEKLRFVGCRRASRDWHVPACIREERQK